MLKGINKDTRTTPLTSCSGIFILTPCVSIVNLEHVITNWVNSDQSVKL